MYGRSVESTVQCFIKIFGSIYKSVSCSTKCITRTDNESESYFLRNLFSLQERSSRGAFTHHHIQLVHFETEFLPVFSSFNCLNINTDDLHAVMLPQAGFI